MHGREPRGSVHCIEHTPFLKRPGLTSTTLEVMNTLKRPRLSPEPFAQLKLKLHRTARPFCTWLKLLSVKSWHSSGGEGGPTVSIGVSSALAWPALSVAVTRALYRPSGKVT